MAQPKKKKSALPELLWASRVQTPPDEIALKFSSSIEIDKRLFREDIAGSIAHAEGLAAAKIISKSDAVRIINGLKRVEKEIVENRLPLRVEQEDIHTAIEQRLTALIGAVGGKLHTARSRNDQVATDERLFLRDAVNTLQGLIREAQRSLLKQSERYKNLIIPGYTHLQQAQPILAAHYLLAWIAMLDRDYSRLADCATRADVSPLGAAAFAGTPLPIDVAANAKRLQFSAAFGNSIDAVSDRDYIIEFASACATIMMHLSRCCEDLVIWSSAEFNLIDCGDAFTTGSSIMPHKRNPDIAELIRGRTGRAYGALMAILTVMKSAPLTYSRDLQEDKLPLFTAFDTARESLEVFSRMVSAMRFNEASAKELLEKNYITATEIADYLVERGVPFRAAHRITGAIVAYAESHHIALQKIPLKEFQHFSPKFEKNIFAVLTPAASVQRKRSQGSTSSSEVLKQIKKWKEVVRGW